MPHLSEAAFDPEHIDILSRALGFAKQKLGIADTDPSRACAAAREIMQLARLGEWDAERLAQQVVNRFAKKAARKLAA